ncbi:MAG: hypothetical protein ACJ763_07025 [Bdellovibrionia bacterium]
MKKNAKNWIQASLLVALTIGGIAQARPGRWADRNDDRFREREVITLGEVVIGNSGHRVDAGTLDVFSNPRIQCGLTHIKLSAFSDSVYLTRIDVEYRDADSYGRNSDSIDMSDDRGPRYGDRRSDDRRGSDGIYLDSGQSTGWLDVDDVMDGRPNGRCIRSIRVFGIDTPDRGDGGRGGRDYGRDRGRGGYGGYHGGGYGGADNYRPASVRVEGLLARRHHEEPRHEAPPVVVVEPRHEEPPIVVAPPRHEPRRELSFTMLGTTGLVSKSKPDTRRIDVGLDKGRFDGIKLIAKDDDFEVKYVEVVFSTQERVRRENIMLKEHDSYYMDFDDFNRGRGDRDRAIDQVIIYGDSFNIFGSKAQVEVWGGR